MFKPHYKLTNGIGRSGKFVKRIFSYKNKLINIQVWEKFMHPDCLKLPSYRCSYGGTKFGFRGMNYLVEDDCLFGIILKFVFVTLLRVKH